MRILYVEDDVRDADLTRRALATRSSGSLFEVETVSTVEEAQGRLEDDPQRYDLALIDLKLSNEDGMDLLRTIRQEGLPVAVVIVTGRGDEAAAVAALKAGADDYVVKRKDYLDNLALTLEDALHRFRSRETRRARPLRVLYAEHSANDIDLTRRHVARHASHIQLDVVHTGAEMLQRLASTSGRSVEAAPGADAFDILLLDYNLPGMNALEVLKEVRQRRGLDVPLVLVTGRGDEDVAVQTLKLGAADYVVKNPGYLHRLTSVLEDVFHRSQLARERAALQESERRYRSIFNGVQDAIVVESLSGEVLDVNVRACKMYGYPREVLLTKTVDDLVPEGAFKLVPAEVPEDELKGKPFESVNVRANGEHFPVEITGELQTVGGETVLLVVARDITERKRAEEELRNAEREKETILDSLVEHVIHEDEDMRVLWANRAACESAGMTREELIGGHCYRVWAEQSTPCEDCPVRRAMATGQPHEVQKSTPDGREWFIRGYPVRDEEGDVVGGIEVTLEITERRRAEMALRRHMERLETLHMVDRAILEARSPKATAQAALGHLRSLVPCVGAGVVTFDLEAPALTLFALDTAEWITAEPGTRLSLEGVMAEVEALREGELFVDAGIDSLSESPPILETLEAAGVRSYVAAPLAARGELIGALGLVSGVPDAFPPEDVDIVREVADQLAVALHQARLSAALETERRRLETTVNHAPEGIVLLDAERRVLLANPTAQDTLASLSERSEAGALASLAGRPVEELLARATAGRRHALTADGRTFELVVRPIGEADGDAEGWVMVIDDVTEQRQRESQVQRQERLAAMGQLAGGIAHDFRNFLSSIVLFADMALRHPDLPSVLVSAMETIISESEQASGLVQQILDFSRRSRMTIQPLDLRPFVQEVVYVLERTIPESISMRHETGPGRYVVQADPTRIQQVLMNLALNARDAMPDGGELRIGLSRVTIAPDERPPRVDMDPGDWVCLAVSDTGVGITEEIEDHLFEPFFTTKEPGQGTGLGLAQVHGIIDQHQGAVEVETEVGVGTTFRCYLPAYEGDQARVEHTAPSEMPQGHGEMILVVEDESRVREAVQSLLLSLDYRVVTAAHGREALEICQVERLDLVITDLVMPEMGGRALVRALQKGYPEVPLLVITGYVGYTDDLEEGAVAGVIEKPLVPAALARAVRRTLDERGQ